MNLSSSRRRWEARTTPPPTPTTPTSMPPTQSSSKSGLVFVVVVVVVFAPLLPDFPSAMGWSYENSINSFYSEVAQTLCLRCVEGAAKEEDCRQFGWSLGEGEVEEGGGGEGGGGGERRGKVRGGKTDGARVDGGVGRRLPSWDFAVETSQLNSRIGDQTERSNGTTVRQAENSIKLRCGTEAVSCSSHDGAFLSFRGVGGGGGGSGGGSGDGDAANGGNDFTICRGCQESTAESVRLLIHFLETPTLVCLGGAGVGKGGVGGTVAEEGVCEEDRDEGILRQREREDGAAEEAKEDGGEEDDDEEEEEEDDDDEFFDDESLDGDQLEFGGEKPEVTIRGCQRKLAQHSWILLKSTQRLNFRLSMAKSDELRTVKFLSSAAKLDCEKGFTVKCDLSASVAVNATEDTVVWISDKLRCDGFMHCVDGSDEIGCHEDEDDDDDDDGSGEGNCVGDSSEKAEAEKEEEEEKEKKAQSQGEEETLLRRYAEVEKRLLKTKTFFLLIPGAMIATWIVMRIGHFVKHSDSSDVPEERKKNEGQENEGEAEEEEEVAEEEERGEGSEEEESYPEPVDVRVEVEEVTEEEEETEEEMESEEEEEEEEEEETEEEEEESFE